MSPNRVEQLEERVKELEASVEGLTDELVECKVRLRELENGVDEDLGFEPEETESPDETVADSTKAQGSDEGDNTESDSSDIIVA